MYSKQIESVNIFDQQDVQLACDCGFSYAATALANSFTDHLTWLLTRNGQMFFAHCASIRRFMNSVLTISLLMGLQPCGPQRNLIQTRDGISRRVL